MGHYLSLAVASAPAYVDRGVVDVLQDEDALSLLLSLEIGGVDLRVGTDGRLEAIGDRLTAPDSARVQCHGASLLALVRVCDAGVQERLEQLRGGSGVIGPGADGQRAGFCFACFDTLPTARMGHCWRCAVSWRLAHGLGVPSSLPEFTR